MESRPLTALSLEQAPTGQPKESLAFLSARTPAQQQRHPQALVRLLLGRAHVAKQVLVSMFTYHGIFIPVPEQFLKQVYTFVPGKRLVVAGAAHLYPSRDVSSRAVDHCPCGHSSPGQGHRPHIRYLPFSGFSTRFIDEPTRVTAYIDAFRQLHPHRLVAVEDLDLSGGHEPALPSVGKSDRAAREDVALAQAAMGHAAVWSGGCPVLHTTQGGLHHLRLAKRDLWQSGIL